MLEGIDIGDAECVRNQRAGCRSAARADGNFVLFGVTDEIPDNEEVSGKLHLLDDGEFALQALFVVCD